MALTSVPGHTMSAAQFYDTVQITTNTNKRDVSDLLDLWVHRETPFLNYLKWGAESGGTQIEWIAEHQGMGYFITGEEITGSAVIEVTITTSDCGDARVAVNQLMTGGALIGYSSDNATYSMFLCYSCTATSSTSGEISIAAEAVTATIDSGTKLYAIGNFTNEGSLPRRDTTNVREVVTNNFGILREDFSITGSMAATDMYAVANETRHQMKMKLLRMQKAREMSILFSYGSQINSARTSTVGTLFDGVYGKMITYNVTNTMDSSTTTLTETAFNNAVANIWEYGCKPNVVVGAAKQIRKFTEWDRARVRTSPRKHLGGFHVQSYLTDIGIEVDLLPMPSFPVSAMFTLDTSKIMPRAKKGRKLFTEKLGVVGDYVQWQMLSEFSVETRGCTNGRLGHMFKALT